MTRNPLYEVEEEVISVPAPLRVRPRILVLRADRPWPPTYTITQNHLCPVLVR